MDKQITVYDQIAANNIKTILLVLLFPVLLIFTLVLFNTLAIYLIEDPEYTEMGVLAFSDIFPNVNPYVNNFFLHICSSIGHLSVFFLPVTVVSFVWMAISYYLGSKMMLGFSRATPIKKSDFPKIYNMAENLAITAGLPTPELYIIEDDSLNAFATGATPKSASIALTRGIIEKLTPLELEGVIAHEMAHIANRDIRLNMLIITGLSIFSLLADVINSAFLKRRAKKQDGKVVMVAFCIFLALVIFNSIIAPIIHMAISRKREYAADANGALLTRNPLALASALEKIAVDSQVEVLHDKPTMAQACIANPHLHNKSAFNSLLASHPPIKSRISILVHMAGRL